MSTYWSDPFSIFAPDSSGLPWWLSAAELWQMLGSGMPNFFASRPPEYPITQPATGPYTPEPVDPKTGLPQSLVDYIWSIEPPSGVPDDLLGPHEVFGLPKWIVQRAQSFLAEQGLDTNNLPLFFQTFPLEFWLSILSTAWTPHYKVDVTAPMPQEPSPPPQETPPQEPPPNIPVTPPPAVSVPPPSYSVDVWGQLPGPLPTLPPILEPQWPGPPPGTSYEPLPMPPDIQFPVTLPTLPGILQPAWPGPPPETTSGGSGNDKGGGGGGGDKNKKDEEGISLGDLLSGLGLSVPPSAPVSGQPAPNVAQLRNLMSVFAVPQYMPAFVPGLRRR